MKSCEFLKKYSNCDETFLLQLWRTLTSVSWLNFVFVRDCLNIVLVEGCDGAESLSWSNVALGATLASALFKMILNHVSVVHLEASFLGSSKGWVKRCVRLQRVSTATFVAHSTGLAVRHLLGRVGGRWGQASTCVWTDLLWSLELDSARAGSIGCVINLIAAH